MKRKFSLVQICRGLAALAVVGYHLNGSATDYFRSSFLGSSFLHGSLGVDFFFVLSGFIITYVHFKDLENRSNKTQFLLKRFIRIYPIYWVFCTVFILILILVFHGNTEHNQLDLSSLKDYTKILANFLLIKGNEDFYLVVAWTLSYEIMFYLVFVLCIHIGLKSSKLVFSIWALLVILKMVFPDSLPNTILFHERILEFLVGCIVAYTLHRMKLMENKVWLVSFCVSLLILLLTYPFWLTNAWGTALLAITNGLIIYKLVRIDAVKDYKYPKLLMLIGEASYSIYLSHFLFFSLFLRIMRVMINKLHIQNGLTIQSILVVVFGCTVFAGIIVYRFLEKPMTNYLNRKFINKPSISKHLKGVPLG